MPTKTQDVRLRYLDFNQTTVGNTSSSNRISGYLSYTRERTGVSNPKWRTIIKNGGDATTAMSGLDVRELEQKPYAFSCVRVLDPPVDVIPVSQSRYGTPLAGVSIGGHLSGTDLVSADNQALTQAYKHLEQNRTQFQGLTALGELGEVIRQLKRPYKPVVELVNAYLNRIQKSYRQSAGRSRSKGRVTEFLRDASDAWLETAFGLAPLMSDVESAAKAMARWQFDSVRNYVYGYGSSVVAKEGSVRDGLGFITVQSSWIDRTVTSVRYKAAVDTTYQAGFGSAERLADLTGFNLSQFVPTLWELAPWSFLLDYVTNTGDVIAAGCASQAGMKYVIRTQRTETLRTGTHTGLISVTPSKMAESLNSPGSFVLSRRTVSRTSSSRLGMPTLTTNLPVGALKYANMAALLASGQKRLNITF